LNGLFDLSGLDNGTVTVNKRAVAAAELFAELQTAFAGPAAAKGIGLRVRMPRDVWLMTDPMIAARILSNLVANALRYTNEGGVLVGCRRHGAQVELQVIDTGIGIAPQEQTRIFSEFYQVEGVAREREGGMGLGLAIAQRSAQLLGSRITVRSMPGRGSCFAFVLPMAAAPATPAVQADAGLREKSETSLPA
jgi:signal transduction histidine kinase